MRSAIFPENDDERTVLVGVETAGVAQKDEPALFVLVPDDQKPNLIRKLITQLGRGDSDTQFGLTRFLCALGEHIVEPLNKAAKSSDEVISNQAKFTLLRFREMQLESAKPTIK